MLCRLEIIPGVSSVYQRSSTKGGPIFLLSLSLLLLLVAASSTMLLCSCRVFRRIASVISQLKVVDAGERQKQTAARRSLKSEFFGDEDGVPGDLASDLASVPNITKVSTMLLRSRRKY